MLTKDQLSNLRRLIQQTEPVEPTIASVEVAPAPVVLAGQVRGLQRAVEDSREARVERFVASRRSIAVCSGKGGVGKSNISVNLAIMLSRLGKKTLLIDADLGLANDDILLGLRPKHHLYHFLCGQKTISEILVEGPHGMQLLPGGSGIAQLADLKEMERTQILSGLSTLGQRAEVVMIDTAAGINRDVLNFVAAAEDALVVTQPEPTSLLDAFGIVKAMVNRGKRNRIWVVVNRARDAAEARRTFDRLDRTARRFLMVELKDAGYVLEDRQVGEAVRIQKPFVLEYPDGPATQSLEKVLRRIFGLTEPVGSGHTGTTDRPLRHFFRKLVEVFERS